MGARARSSSWRRRSWPAIAPWPALGSRTDHAFNDVRSTMLELLKTRRGNWRSFTNRSESLGTVWVGAAHRASRFREVTRRWTRLIDVGPGRSSPCERIEHLIDLMSIPGVVVLTSESPLRSASRLLEAALVAVVDPDFARASIAAARMAATCGVPLNCAVATGINLLGDDHGGAGEQCMELLYEAATRVAADPTSLESVAEALIAERLRSDERIPGFGHQLHKDEDPRRRPMLRLIDDAIAADEIKGSFAHAALALEAALAREKGQSLGLTWTECQRRLCELGLPPAAARPVLLPFCGVESWHTLESCSR